MEGKNAIISNIISAAESAARGIMSEAQAEKDANLERLRNDLINNAKVQIESANINAAELIKRRGTLCALEERKIILQAKQKVIESVYYQIVTKILNMTDNIYRDFMSGIICKYAEDGDMVIVSERDAKRLHADWVDGISKKLNIRLTLSSEYGKARGGVVLQGKKYDKNLTLESMVELLRASTEGETAKKLFGNI